MFDKKELIKKLRSFTSAGFMDCKKALEESEYDLEKAVNALRKNGQAKASKKANNSTDHSSVFISSNEKGTVVLKFSAETDFAVNSPAFCKFVSSEGENFLNSSEAKIENVTVDGQTFEERLTFFISTLGENVRLNEFKFFEASSDEKVSYYLHAKINSDYSNVAKLGVVLVTNNASEEILKNLVSHIAANDPIVVSESDLTKDMLLENPDAKDLVLENQSYDFGTESGLTIGEVLKKNSISIKSFTIIS